MYLRFFYYLCQELGLTVILLLNHENMKAEETNIFISYRRVDGRDIARTIQLALEKRGYQNVFFDYSSMREGAFNTQILTAIENCKDFLLVLSPQSMARCNVQGDWVATEIEKAISVGCNIIPVSINEPFDNWPSDLPRKLIFLKRQQMLTLRTDEYFESSIERLTGWLESKAIESTMPGIQKNVSLTISVDETCELFINGKKVRKIKGGRSVRLDDIEKNVQYHIAVYSLARVGDSIEQDYSFPNNGHNTDELSFSFSNKRAEDKKREEEDKKQKKIEREGRYSKDGLLKQMVKLYDQHGLSNDGMLAVMKNGMIGFLDDSSLEVIPCIYEDVSAFYNGYATVCKNGKWEIINKMGQTVSRFYSDTPCVFLPGFKYYMASREGKYNVFPFTPKNMEKSPRFIYDAISFIEDQDDVFFAQEGSAWIMKSCSGESTPCPFVQSVKNIETYKYYDVEFFKLNPFSDSLYPKVCRFPLRIQNIQTGKFGYLNRKLNLAIPFVDELSGEECGTPHLEIIQVNDKMGLVDAESGKTIIPPMYAFIHQIYRKEYYPLFILGDGSKPYSYTIDAKGKRKNEWRIAWGGLQGVVDAGGDVVIPFQYQRIDCCLRNGRLFFFAYKLTNCSVNNYRFSSADRWEAKYFAEYTFDESYSEIHVYDMYGTLLLKRNGSNDEDIWDDISY